MSDTIIRNRRRLTNDLIARHEAPALKPFFDPKVTLIAGDGSVLAGIEALLAAFAGQFAEPGFGAYLRTTDSVTMDQAGSRAAETGHWLGSWHDGSTMTGTYLAAWKKRLGLWVIESELYITLGGSRR